jgi:hypothetical protein
MTTKPMVVTKLPMEQDKALVQPVGEGTPAPKAEHRIRKVATLVGASVAFSAAATTAAIVAAKLRTRRTAHRRGFRLTGLRLIPDRRALRSGRLTRLEWFAQRTRIPVQRLGRSDRPLAAQRTKVGRSTLRRVAHMIGRR